MAILRSLDGKFYEVPDKDLENYEMPEERVKEIVGPSAGQGGSGDVDPYGWKIYFGGWRNCWRNWRNCGWRNCY
jgi:hypothetical protein